MNLETFKNTKPEKLKELEVMKLSIEINELADRFEKKDVMNRFVKYEDKYEEQVEILRVLDSLCEMVLNNRFGNNTEEKKKLIDYIIDNGELLDSLLY